MDPQKIETYTVGSFWLREHLNQPRQAEAFLREGLRSNPNSYEILFELGRLYSENYHDTNRARDIWELAARRWNELDPKDKKDNTLSFDEITVHLANLEENAGNLTKAVQWLEAAQKVSNTPEALQKQIDELKAKIPTPTNTPSVLP